ncbi:hypothetical protein [Sulfitobacter sabulilitoris]|uniref:Uncharacterized protein n=1 Tax=Sulfitobacter sabulilitoris TaxID=2562655 RepID=A0A5S3PCD2_9RHOB|nr:hypothetical protein [Sulfitobacter sabulilitoris]TMM51247.1 hypothetical protein FDT80_15430 [Sulfitobacter sabulilitoris]
MFTIRNIVAAVIAGVVGTIANSLVVSGLTGAPLWGLILSFGREAVAIAVALLLIPIFLRMRRWQPWVVGIAVLTVVPSLLAKTVFGVAAPWGVVLGVNAVYAVAATVVFALIVRGKMVVESA